MAKMQFWSALHITFLSSSERVKAFCLKMVDRGRYNSPLMSLIATASQCGCITGIGSVIYSKWHSMFSWFVGWFLVHPLFMIRHHSSVIYSKWHSMLRWLVSGALTLIDSAPLINLAPLIWHHSLIWHHLLVRI